MGLSARVQGRRREGKGRGRPGQAIVEMTFVISLLLVLTFGIADLGLLMYRYVQAANCVREIARRAVVRQDIPADTYCVDSDLQDEVVINPASYKTHPVGEPLTATLDVDHTWIVIGYLIPGLGSTFPIHAEETMRMEGQKL